MQYKLTTCLSALLLIAGCRGDDKSQSWEQMSGAINSFAATHSGTVFERSPSTDDVPGCRRWIIFVPVKDLSHSGLIAIADALVKATCDANSFTYPMRGGYTDPTLTESLQDGTLVYGAGPALILERDCAGDSGAILIRAKGLVADMGGGYYTVMKSASMPAGKKAVSLDVMVSRWR